MRNPLKIYTESQEKRLGALINAIAHAQAEREHQKQHVYEEHKAEIPPDKWAKLNDKRK